MPAKAMQQHLTNILVTGAAGFIGSHTVDCLLRQGCSVTGVDNFRTGSRSNLDQALGNDRFRLVTADLRNQEQILKIFASTRPEAVIHLAALVSVPESIADPQLNFDLNVSASVAIGEACRLMGVRRLVFASSAAVYGEQLQQPIPEGAPCSPQSPYGASKLAAEIMLNSCHTTSPLIVRHNRYFNVYGPRQFPGSPYSGAISRFSAAVQGSQPISIHGDGSQVRDFIHVQDVARANCLAATAPNLAGGTVNVCSGSGTTILELASLLIDCAAAPTRIEHTPRRAGDIHQSVGDPTQARLQIGFESKIPLRDGLRQMVQPIP